MRTDPVAGKNEQNSPELLRGRLRAKGTSIRPRFRGPRLGSLPVLSLPRPAPLEFHLQRPAQEGPHHHDRGEDTHTGEGRIDRHGPDDIPSYQDFEPEEDRAADALPVRPVNLLSLARQGRKVKES
jgi:hypothetical protein